MIEWTEDGNEYELMQKNTELLKYENGTLIGSFPVKDLPRAGYVNINDVLKSIGELSGCYSCGERSDKKISVQALIEKLNK